MTRFAFRCFRSQVIRTIAGVLVGAAVGLFATQTSLAQGLAYVDADHTVNLSPAGQYSTSGTATTNNSDGLWWQRTPFGAVNGGGTATVYEAGISENAQQITQTISGLTPGNSYDMYVVFWCDPTNWRINATVQPDPLTLFNRTGPLERTLLALRASWDAPPLDGNATPIFSEGNRGLYLGYAGTATADGAGQVQVDVNDVSSSGSSARTWFDGVAYVPEGTSIVQYLRGDFDSSGGTVDVNDYQTLMTYINQPNPANTSPATVYTRGDINLDFTVNYQDLFDFAVEYDLQNGEGSFAAMAGTVPEPGAIFLLIIGCGLFLIGAKRSYLRRVAAFVGSRTAQSNLLATLACIAVCGQLLPQSASADPVTGWLNDPLLNPGASLTNAETNSPTLGDGSANNADNAGIYAVIPQIDLMPGQQATLSGSVTITGGLSTATATGGLRFGMFREIGAPPDTAGWLGYMVENSTGGRNGHIHSRNPAGTNFATTTWASDLSGRAKITAIGGNGPELFGDGTYDFSLTVARFDDDTTTSHASIVSTTSAYSMYAYRGTESDPGVVTFSLDRVGFLAPSVFDADQFQFANIDVTVGTVAGATLRVTQNGNVSIFNPTGAPLDLKFYEIASPTGILDSNGWATIDSTESDAFGTGWDITGTPTASLLSEFNLQGSTSLAANNSIQLGMPVPASTMSGLQFYYGLETGEVYRGIVEYVTETQPGDFDNDGDVDGSDFVVWQMNFPTTSGASVTNGDADGDGDVDGADFIVWQTNYPFSPGPGASPVPEPAAGILAIGALAAAFLARRRR